MYAYLGVHRVKPDSHAQFSVDQSSYPAICNFVLFQSQTAVATPTIENMSYKVFWDTNGEPDTI